MNDSEANDFPRIKERNIRPFDSFLGKEEMRDKLTTHEIVNDRIDGRVEVAQPVRDQSRRYGEVVLRDTHRVPAPVDRLGVNTVRFH